MNVLFIHQNFPGQFIHLSAELARNQMNRIVALGMNDRPVPRDVELRRYSLLRPAAVETHPLLRDQESHVLRAEACAAAALKLKQEGFVPDIIIAHPGWGEALFIKDVFPAAKLLIYCEYYYALEGQDVGFDPDEPPLDFQKKARLRLKNATNLLSLQIADAAISPTHWQKSTYPKWAQEKISVIHDGIDTERLQFNPNAKLTLEKAGKQIDFSPGDEVLAYVSRNLEPTRGFHQLMRSLPRILLERPGAHVIIVGGDEVSYGYPAPSGMSWKEHMLQEVGGQLDLSRVHFLGKIPYSHYLALLSIARVHAYWTTPFVLSWSFLESCFSGAHIVASATPPVQEFSDIFSVQTRPFHDVHAFSDAIIQGLMIPERRKPPACTALELSSCLRQQEALIADLLS